MKYQGKLFSLGIFLLAALFTNLPAWAKDKNMGDTLEPIIKEADVYGYAPVYVYYKLDDGFDWGGGWGKLEAEVGRMERALLVALGDKAIQHTVESDYINAGSHMYVRKAALPLLDADPSVKYYRFTSTGVGFNRAGTDEDIAKIRQEIEKSGYADVDALLNVEHFDLGSESAEALAALNIGKDEWDAAQAREALPALEELKAALPAAIVERIQVISYAGAKLKLRIGHEEIYALKGMAKIRNLRLQGSELLGRETPVDIDPNALEDALIWGEANLSVRLRPIANYTSKKSYMPYRAEKYQGKIIRARALKAFRGYAADELVKMDGQFIEFGFVDVVLTEKGVRRLIANPDPAIERVSAMPVRGY